MKNTKKIIALFLAFVMVFALCACSASTNDGGKDTEKTDTKKDDTPKDETKKDDTNEDTGSATIDKLTIGLSVDPGSMSPCVGMNDGRSYSIPSIFEPLVQAYKGQPLQGVLAKSWEVADDGKTYNFELYDYIVDSDGNHITADDVVFSYNTFVEVGGCGWVKYIDHVTKTGEYTFEFALTDSTVGTFENVICQLYIFSQDAYEASADQMNATPVGTGVYKLESYTSGAGFTLVKNENYWQKPELAFNYANIDTLDFKIVLETATLAVQLETGEIDLAPAMSGDALARFKDGGEDDADFDVYSMLDFKFYCLMFDMDPASVVSDNLKLRQAIATAIDPLALIIGANGGDGDTIKAYGNEAYYDYVDKWKDENYDFYNYNVEKAKQLLDESGYDTTKPIKLLISQSNIFENLAALIQAECAAIGLDVKINEVETAVFNASAKNDTSLFDIRIDCFGSPQHYVAAAIQGSFDQRRYTNTGTTNMLWDDELQSLVVAACDVTTYSVENTEKLCDYMQETIPAYPLFSTNVNIVYNNSKISGMGNSIYDRGITQWGMLEIK